MNSSPRDSQATAQSFVAFALESGVLKFGEFVTKAGRLTPYFFNAGLFDDGQKLARLASFYAQALLKSDIEFDMIFGPAYKGIPLGATLARTSPLPTTEKSSKTMVRVAASWVLHSKDGS